MRIIMWVVFVGVMGLKGVALAEMGAAGATPSTEALSPKASDLLISGYLEAYYLQDFNRPNSHERAGFVYSHNQTQRPQINLALLKAAYNTPRVRGNLALASGTYMRANYAAEPEAYRHIFEANIGVRLSEESNLWLDVGVMPSHIGFESAMGADNWTVTRSLMADNSPYFETGAKVSYTTDDGKWLLSGLVLTGWQRIQQPEGNSGVSFGHQLTYKANERLTLNSSSFVGNDKSDAARQLRLFHNLYAQYQLTDRWRLILALDVGAEQREKHSSDYHYWYSPNIIAKYQYSDKLSIAGRIEQFRDPHGVIISTGTAHGFNTYGLSSNIDYAFHPNALLRAEVRQLHSQEAIFEHNDSAPRHSNLMFVTAITFRF